MIPLLKETKNGLKVPHTYVVEYIHQKICTILLEYFLNALLKLVRRINIWNLTSVHLNKYQIFYPFLDGI